MYPFHSLYFWHDQSALSHLVTWRLVAHFTRTCPTYLCLEAMQCTHLLFSVILIFSQGKLLCLESMRLVRELCFSDSLQKTIDFRETQMQKLSFTLKSRTLSHALWFEFETCLQLFMWISIDTITVDIARLMSAITNIGANKISI